MLEALDAERGNSYLDRKTLPTGAAKAEGKPGTYWRGAEGIAKMRTDILELFISSQELFDFLQEQTVLYVMLHGWMPTRSLNDLTKSGRLSTIHETVFVQDEVPGSAQATSTGAGHFQGNQLDIKYA